MSSPIQSDHFNQALYALLDETFDNVQGYFLDKGTSMFETLADISAEEASIPVGDKCATLAAQVKHVAFYLDVLEKAIRTQQFERQDWGKIWRETSAVTPEEWGLSNHHCVRAISESKYSLLIQPSGRVNGRSAGLWLSLPIRPIIWARFGRRCAA